MLLITKHSFGPSVCLAIQYRTLEKSGDMRTSGFSSCSIGGRAGASPRLFLSLPGSSVP